MGDKGHYEPFFGGSFRGKSIRHRLGTGERVRLVWDSNVLTDYLERK
jgi:hypothetical protein